MQQDIQKQIEKEENINLNLKTDFLFKWIIPIVFQQDLNMYRLIVSDNSFVNQLNQNHLGFKYSNLINVKEVKWYLQPEETLYLVSIQQLSSQFFSNSNQQKLKKISQFQQLKQQNIRKVYSNCKKNDTIKLLFYLNIRKKSKMVRKCFTQVKFEQKKSELLSINFSDFCYKIYSTSADYRKDENYQIFVLVDNKSKITQLLFTNEIKIICQKFKVSTLKFILFENHDYMIIQTGI